MAFGKKKNRLQKTTLISLLIIMFLSATALGGNYLYSQQINSIKEDYEEELEELRYIIYENNRLVLVAKDDIQVGATISSERVMEKFIYSDLPYDSYITEEDLGKVATVNIGVNMPIYKNMLATEEITNDMRVEELNMLLLQSDSAKDKFVDIRITYPNGENFIVISKKKIRDIDLGKNTIWLWLTELEILQLSSAVVDAYIHQGTKLYTVAYIEPNLQKEAITTYVANSHVLKLMEVNPNIVGYAKDELRNQVRQSLEERLSRLNKDDITKVGTGINTESVMRNDKIRSHLSNFLEEIPIPSQREETERGAIYGD